MLIVCSAVNIDAYLDNVKYVVYNVVYIPFNLCYICAAFSHHFDYKANVQLIAIYPSSFITWTNYFFKKYSSHFQCLLRIEICQDWIETLYPFTKIIWIHFYEKILINNTRHQMIFLITLYIHKFYIAKITK